MVRNIILDSTNERVSVLEFQYKELKREIEDILTIQNDINEDTRAQLELVNQALAELQVRNREPKPSRRIEF